MIYNNVKLGADPELFLINETGKYISSVGLIGGTKEKPLPIDENGNCLQEDNVAVEFNIKPSVSKEEFVFHLNKTIDELENRIKDKQLHLAIIPAVEFDWDQLSSIEAQTFGCEPDYNAWTGEMNPAPFCSNLQLRSAGGHIHIGWDNPNKQSKLHLMRAMDIFLGVPSTQHDKDEQRRKLYGKPGAFRPKQYGAEYRTLSNFWIATKEMQEWAYEQTMKAISFLNAGGSIAHTDKEFVDKAILDKDEASFTYLKERYCF